MKTEEIRLTSPTGYLILPIKFIDRGWNFLQIKREDDLAIYVKNKHGVKSFEVIRIKNQEGFTLAENYIPAKEVYPSSESWGTMAFTYSDCLSAENKFQELKNELN